MLADMIICQLPSPPMAQRYRIEALYAGNISDSYGQGITKCDPNAPLMVYTSRIVQEKDKRTDASKDKTVLARVLSGSMRAGRKIRVLDQDFFMGENECVYTDIVQFRDGKKRDVRTGDLVVLESSGQWKPVGATITGVEDIGASLLKPPRYLKFPNAQSTKDIDKKVGIIWDERFISGHIPYNNKNEIPDRTNKIMESLRVQGLLPRCKTMRPTNSATLDDVALVHTPEYINSVKDICAITDTEMRNDEAGAKFGDLYLSKKSFKTALLAAGAAIEVVEKVIKKELDSAFAIVRPPGHHAEANKGMGFCVFNNVAVAASVVLGRLIGTYIMEMERRRRSWVTPMCWCLTYTGILLLELEIVGKSYVRRI
ncbi:hypothetical protein C5167_023052 [Papaver somniferum]|uniref:histone deacetylase n=1 Tax=Papaver somniferum TaxID=3469 RepID=A0A4Y7JJP8_PAPSO|nr:hypothetical protein C5167_023052 [Papaver somniferum]